MREQIELTKRPMTPKHPLATLADVFPLALRARLSALRVRSPLQERGGGISRHDAARGRDGLRPQRGQAA
jgi:hypothetical protein